MTTSKHWRRYRKLELLVKRKGVVVPFAVAAKLLQTSVRIVRRLVRAGRLEEVRVGEERFVVGKSVERCAKEGGRRGGPTVFWRKWTAKEEALLGNEGDRKVARLIGASFVQVQRRRAALGISPFFKRKSGGPWRPWTAEELAVIGKGEGTDAEVGKLLGRSAGAVSVRRRVLGVRKQSWERWTKREVKLLGKYADRLVAEKLGRTVGSVSSRRRKLGIPRGDAGVAWHWTAEEDAMVGQGKVAEVAAKLGRTVGAVWQRRRILGLKSERLRRWTAEEDRLVGTIPTGEATVKLGRSRKAIISRRLSLGLRTNNWRPWTATEDQLLGTAPDREIGERLGRKLGVVFLRRKKLGIGASNARGVA